MSARQKCAQTPLNKSPSPEIPTDTSMKEASLLRCSRATSEARSDAQRSPECALLAPENESPSKLTEAQIAEYRRSRAGSETPTINPSLSSPLRRETAAAAALNASKRSSRAGSEAPDRDALEAISQRSSRGTSEVPDRGAAAPGSPTGPSSVKRTTALVQSGSKKMDPLQQPMGGRMRTHALTFRSIYSSDSVALSLQDAERRLYQTVESATGAFRYFQRLHYPLDPENHDDEEDAEGMRPTITTSGCGGVAGGKEASPHARRSTDSGGGGGDLLSGGSSASSPSPTFDDASFNAMYDAQDVLEDTSINLNESFNFQPPVDDTLMQSVSVLAMTTLPDPLSGAPVLGLCLGDYSGRIEYVEVSTSEASNRRIRSSRSATATRRSLSKQQLSKHRGTSVYSNTLSSTSVDTNATDNVMAELRGREVVRRHNHKAFIKTINPLTSVSVEPSVKCLSFVRPHSSPSMISYLAANERVIKLFHVRREGFSPFGVFPFMENVLGPTFLGSRYCARLPQQTSILPIKEFGPTANSIQALSTSADGRTFISVEDLQVFWWDLDAADTTKGSCIADLRPPSGALDEVEELVTAASFHPTHSSLFLLSRSSGVLNIGDLRDPPSRERRQFSITTQILPNQNPVSCPSYDEILCSISAASFLGPDHVVTRDYLSLKLWDLRKPATPYAMVPVMKYVTPYLNQLYENDAIFDRFPVAVDNVSGTVATGLYDGAVAVWQPLNKSVRHEALMHYRVDPNVEPQDSTTGGCVTVKELEETLKGTWEAHGSKSNGSGVAGAAADTAGNLDYDEMMGGQFEDVPEPFTNKVLNIAIAPGGERLAYTYKNGKLVYVLKRKSSVLPPA